VTAKRRRAETGVGIAILALGTAFAMTRGAVVRAAPVPAECTGAEFRQFDFWLGDWDAFDVTDSTKIVGRGTVTSILGGCVLRESYRQNDGLVGESYNIWDASRGVWHQSWVTNGGRLLLLDGRFVAGRMVLTAHERKLDGTSSLLRGTWWVEGRNVREKAERSLDDGKTWSPAFDMVFRPHHTS